MPWRWSDRYLPRRCPDCGRHPPVEAFEDVSELARWDALSDKTVLKMMREMGLRCGIRRERAYHRYNSYKGAVGQSFKNIIGRDFTADGPWQKLGADVTEFKLSFGKAYLATYITHWNTTRRQVKLKGLTPAEYRDQALQEAA